MWAKTALCFVFVFSICSYLGCGGHEPTPIAAHQIGDDNRSCESLRLEIAQNDALALKKAKKDDSKFATNTLWFLLWPPAMDLKEAEKTEAEALRYRNECLKILMSEKGCGATSATNPTGKSVQPPKTDQKNQEKPNAPITKSPTVIQCDNCGCKIGKLERAYVYEGHIVCSQCYSKLKKQP